MTGGSFAHSRIQGRLITALNNRLLGKPCQPCGPDMRTPTGGGRYRYPDALVTCAPVRPDALDAPELAVLFEVLSPSTEHEDRRVKLRKHCSIPCVRRYVMPEQDEVTATVVARTGTSWGLDLVEEGGTLIMPEMASRCRLRSYTLTASSRRGLRSRFETRLWSGTTRPPRIRQDEGLNRSGFPGGCLI